MQKCQAKVSARVTLVPGVLCAIPLVHNGDIQEEGFYLCSNSHGVFDGSVSPAWWPLGMLFSSFVQDSLSQP